MTALKYWDGAAWQTVPAIQGPTGPTGLQGPAGVAGLLNAQSIYGANNGTKAILTTQVICIDAAGSTALALSYTPPVNAWWVLDFHSGQFVKTDAAYHVGYTQIRCTDADGKLTGVQSESQHTTVQTNITRQVHRLLKMNAGVAYYADVVFSASGGTWSYYQGSDYLWMTAMAFAR